MPKTQKRAGFPLAVLVAAALLAAVSIICGKYLAIRAGDTLRFSFENLPILLGGLAFGPVVGVGIAVCADLIGCLMVGYAINPIITVGGALIGLIGGLGGILLKKTPLWLQVGLTVLVAHLIGSVVVKTIGLAAFYNMPLWELMLWRLLNYVVVGGIEAPLLYAVLHSRAIQNQLHNVRGR